MIGGPSLSRLLRAVVEAPAGPRASTGGLPAMAGGGTSGVRAAMGAVAVAAWVFAVWIVVDTLRSVVPRWSPLPWFDDWATVELVAAWRAGDLSTAEMLFAQHNEHRILVARLVFLADDLFFRGGGWLSLCAIFTVQALHAALFAAVLARARPAWPGRSAVAAVVLALMFSLRQAENFTSALQLAFVGVFAGATLSFVLFGAAVARGRRGASVVPPLLASFAAVLLTTFTMANGLAAGFVLVVLALVGRMGMRIVLACLVWAVLLAAIYFHGYDAPVAGHDGMAASLRHPLDLLLYVSVYLGNIAAPGHIGLAAPLGALGIAALLAAAIRTLRQARPDPITLALFGVMLFAGCAAVVTALGRLEFGPGQALSSRYVTGGVAFWAAQLVFWWTARPPRPAPRAASTCDPQRIPPAASGRSDGVERRGALARGAVAIVALVLCCAMTIGQRSATPSIVAQSFAQNESADLLMLGLVDEAVIRRSAWSAQGVESLLPMLKADRLSIFGTAEAEGLGRPVTEQGALLPPDTCGGQIVTATADPALGQDGVRASGVGWIGPARHLLRRIFLADGGGRLVGFASGAIPAAGRSDWRGFAVLPPGGRLTAFGKVDGGHLCRVGDATVADGSARDAARAP